LTACERLGYKPEDVIVFEDAPAGVQGARRAGCTVIACETTHKRGELKEAGANCVVKLLADIDLTMVSDGSFDVTATEPL
jgi:beta-phosphoglucomutase-like phosphatase (HAD superfamily)